MPQAKKTISLEYGKKRGVLQLVIKPPFPPPESPAEPCWTIRRLVLGFNSNRSLTLRCFMKSCLLVPIVILAMALLEPSPVAAQMYYPAAGNNYGSFGYRPGPSYPAPTYGMFGSRTLGGTLFPFTASGMFGNRIIGGQSTGVVTSGMFGPRFVGPAFNSANPGFQYGPAATPLNSGLPNFLSPAPAIEVPPAGPESEMNNMNNMNNAPQQPAAPEPATQPNPAPIPPTGNPAAPAAEQGLAAPSVTATPAAMNIPFPLGWAFEASLPPSRCAIRGAFRGAFQPFDADRAQSRHVDRAWHRRLVVRRYRRPPGIGSLAR